MITLKFKKTFDEETIDMEYLIEELNEKTDNTIKFEYIGNELIIHDIY